MFSDGLTFLDDPRIDIIAAGSGDTLPAVTYPGQIFFLTTTNALMFNTGTAWQSVTDILAAASATALDAVYDIALTVDGKPQAGSVLLSLVAPRPFYITAGFPKARAVVSTIAYTNAYFSLQKNGTEFAKISFDGTSLQGVFSNLTSNVSFAKGDVFSIVSLQLDLTLSNMSILIPATFATS